MQASFGTLAHSLLQMERSSILYRLACVGSTTSRVRRVFECALGWAFLCLFVFVPGATAQIRSGTITGLVTDSKGAAVVDATVAITNTGTHATYSTSTSQTGLFTMPYLETGTYSVSISKAGFETNTLIGLALNSSETLRADAQLKVGAVSTRVEVQAATEQLQTENSTISAGISALVVEQIPNITENPLYYTTLDSNVQPRNEVSTSVGMGTYNNAFGIGVAGRAEFSAIGVNGGRALAVPLAVPSIVPAQITVP